MKTIFETSFNKFLDLFHNIEFVDSVEDYDRFCVINKNNEKRKALSCFFINLMVNGIVEKKQIIGLLQELLNKFDEYVQSENKTNEINLGGPTLGVILGVVAAAMLPCCHDRSCWKFYLRLPYGYAAKQPQGHAAKK